MKYFGNWSNYDEMIKDIYRAEYDYEKGDRKPLVIPPEAPKDEEILFAVYGTPSYEGYAIVVYERDGVLYEMNGSHCSCYGLEETMGGPEETSRAALGIREFSVYHEYGDDAIARFKELFPKEG